MRFACPICNSKSGEIDGAETRAIEGGFLELCVPHGHVSSGYSACSFACMEQLAKRVIAETPSVITKNTPSKQWKCPQCNAALPLHPYCGSLEGATSETVPCYCPRITISSKPEWKYICFDSDKCMMEYLRAAALREIQNN